MKKRNRKHFINSLIREAEKLNICNYYKYLVDDLKDLFLNEEDKLRSKFRKAKSWANFTREVEECAREFIYSQEIIGYKNALDFLAKFDPSFRVGLEEAKNEDWTFSALWSEELAGLALRSILKDAIYDILRALKKEETSSK